VTVFEQNRNRLGYFNGSDINASDHLAGFADFEILVEVTGNPDALDAILHQSPAGARILLWACLMPTGNTLLKINDSSPDESNSIRGV